MGDLYVTLNQYYTKLEEKPVSVVTNAEQFSPSPLKVAANAV